MPRSTQGARRRIGRVSLYVHHGSWHLYYRDRGHPVRTSVGSGGPLAECTAALVSARLTADAAGLNLDELITSVLRRPSEPAATVAPDGPPVPIVAVLRKHFLDHHEHVLHSAPATLTRYAAATAYLDRYATQVGLASALALRVPAFVEYLRRVDVTPNGHANTAKRKLRDKGVRYILEICRSMYRYGVRHGHLPRQMPNPFDDSGIGALKVRDSKTIFVFSSEQELKFLNACDPWAFAIHLMPAKTGLRPGELVHLLMEDLDLKEGWLWVRGKPELGWVTKTNRDRRVPLAPELVDLLRYVVGSRKAGPVFTRAKLFLCESPPLGGNRASLAATVRLRAEHEAKRLGRALSRREHAGVCRGVWRDSGAADVDRIRTSFVRAAAGVGLDATCPKSWRHTFATLLQEGEVDPLARQEVMGHAPSFREQSALGMTGVYTHTHPETLRRQVLRALRLRAAPLASVASRIVSTAQPNDTAEKREVNHGYL